MSLFFSIPSPQIRDILMIFSIKENSFIPYKNMRIYCEGKKQIWLSSAQNERKKKKERKRRKKENVLEMENSLYECGIK